MNKRISLFLCNILLLAMVSSRAAAREDCEQRLILPADPATLCGAAAEDVEKYRQIVDFMEAKMRAAGVPGGAIAIIRHGKIRLAAGLGVKTKGGTDPVTPDTLFRLASITKTIGAVTAMAMVDRGRLDLHRPITAYVPWLATRAPYAASQITMHDVLNHRSGLPERVGSGGCFSGPTASADYFRSTIPMQLWSPPGRYWKYGTTDYALAGLVMETIEGRSYDQIVQALVFDPARMRTATFDPVRAQAADHATGYEIAANGNVTATYEPISTDCASHRPAGRAMASVLDLAKLVRVLILNGHGVISPASARLMQSPLSWTGEAADTFYGYGTWSSKYKGLDIVRHNGATGGFLTDFAIVPDQRDAVVVMLNANGPGSIVPAVIRNYALDVLFGLEEVAPDVRTTAPETWSAYEGAYFDPVQWGQIRIQLRGRQLWGAFPSLKWEGPFTQVNENVFTIAPPGAGLQNVIFSHDALVFILGTVAERVQ